MCINKQKINKNVALVYFCVFVFNENSYFATPTDDSRTNNRLLIQLTIATPKTKLSNIMCDLFGNTLASYLFAQANNNCFTISLTLFINKSYKAEV